MFSLLRKKTESKYSINDLNIDNFLNKCSGKLRESVKILFVDDEELEFLEKLKSQKFNVSYKSDIENIYDVSEYDIILCDIRGIGKNFDSFEGAYLIKEIKKQYPEKYIISYTASMYNPDYNKYLNHADNVITKGVSSESWIDHLDSAILKIGDPKYKWQKIREDLLNDNFDIKFVAEVEHYYVKSIKEGSFDSLNELVRIIDKEENNNHKKSQAVKDIIESLSKTIFMKILEFSFEGKPAWI